MQNIVFKINVEIIVTGYVAMLLNKPMTLYPSLNMMISNVGLHP